MDHKKQRRHYGWREVKESCKPADFHSLTDPRHASQRRGWKVGLPPKVKVLDILAISTNDSTNWSKMVKILCSKKPNDVLDAQ